MNFRLNSRTRPQTDDRPAPGTRANINDIRPGVITPADVTSEMYMPAKDFGRVVALNHTLASDICLGMNVESVDVNHASRYGQSGNISVVLCDEESGKRFMILTDNLVVASGLGDENAQMFGTQQTKEIISIEQQRKANGQQAIVLTVEQLLREIDGGEIDFPLQGRKRIAVIGGGDGARVAVGKLLGYEPRTDKSVTQLDFVEHVDWFGQNARTLKEFVKKERLRYVQLGLELPRNTKTNRFSRVTAIDSKVTQLSYSGGDSVVDVTTESGVTTGNYDLVVIATGYEPTALETLRRQPLTVKEALEIIDESNPHGLKVGDLVEYAPGFSLSSIEVVASQGQDLLIKFTKPDKTFGYFNIPNTKAAITQYLSPEAITGKEMPLVPRKFDGLIGYSQFAELDRESQIKKILTGSIVWCFGGSSNRILRVTGRDTDTQLLTADRVSFNGDGSTETRKIKISVDEIIDDIRSRAYLVIDAPYAFDAPDSPENGYTSRPLKTIGTSAVITGIIDGSIPSGSLLIDSNEKSSVTIIDCNEVESSNLYQVTFIRKGAIYQGRESFTPAALEDYIKDFNLDTFVAPSLVYSNEPTSSEPETKPQTPLGTLRAIDEAGFQKSVAKFTSDIPGVYIVGPATDIPVDPELVKLIPNIPENPVSMFASAENVRLTADVVAENVRRRLIGTAQDNRLVLEDRPHFKPTYIGIQSTRKSARGPIFETSITPRPRRFNPKLPASLGDEAALLTLSALIRDANIKTMPGYNHTVRFKVSADSIKKGCLYVTDPTYSTGQISKFKNRRSAFFDYLIGDSLVAEYMLRELGAAPSIDVQLVFNERGLDVRATQIVSNPGPKIPGRRTVTRPRGR